MKYRKYPHRLFRHIVSVPFIYSVLIPILFLDIMVEVYHHLCFPLYGLPLVARKRYIVFDRVKLAYLSPREKINCAYCSYVNGFLRYAAEIAARTEAYWCGIKNRRQQGYIEPPHHRNFLRYGDENGYRDIGHR